MDYKITYSILDIGFLLKFITVVSNIRVHADNSIFRKADNCFNFMSTLIPPPTRPSIGQILVGKQQVAD